MKKILIIVLILSGSAQADIFDTVGTFIGNSLETIFTAMDDPCTSSGKNKCKWENPSDGSGKVCRCDNGVL